MKPPFPATSGELLRQLEVLIPEVLPKSGMSHDEIIYLGGRRSVVHMLKQWRDGALEATAAARPRGQGRSTR